MKGSMDPCWDTEWYVFNGEGEDREYLICDDESEPYLDSLIYKGVVEFRHEEYMCVILC